MKMFWHNPSTKRLRRMMEAIRSRDFTLRYSTEKLSGEERRLVEEINAMISEFRETQARQEAQYGSYETLLNQVSAALIVDDCNGKVLWMNEKAIRDLCGFRIHSLNLLASLHPTLPKELDNLLPGQHKLLQLRVADKDVNWNVSMVKYSREGSEQRLFSIENLQSVLQQNEVETQKKLVSVLTHEIMNSLSPIISLSDTLLDSLSATEGEEKRDADDVRMAIQAIHRRSEGLLSFVENYRQLSKLSLPKKERVRIGDIISDLQSLFADSHIIYNIEDATEELNIDRTQIEQVLINLLKNAMEKAPLTPTFEIRVSTHADRADSLFCISVIDNGEGILPEVLDRIFVPFFSTKANGSGIGLSLCRQIVNNHNGIIRVSSRPGHTEFIVQLPLPCP